MDHGSCSKEEANATFDESLENIDFIVNDRYAILYISKGDVCKNSFYKQKIVRFKRKSKEFHSFILLEHTKETQHEFYSIQELVTIELGMQLHPVSDSEEALHFIKKMAKDNEKNEKSISTDSSEHLDAEKNVVSSALNTLTMIPKLGKVKSKHLLQTVKSMGELMETSEESLATIVGKSVASSIKSSLSKSE